MLLDFREDLKNKKMFPHKQLVKKGTLDIDIVESTPVVWKDKLFRFEWIRDEIGRGYYGNGEGCSYFRFTDMETEESMPSFGHNMFFGSAYVEGDTAYAFGVAERHRNHVMNVLWSKDMVHWESKEILRLSERLYIYNSSVCKGKDGYYMAIELGGDVEIVSVPFTIVFAKSQDLLNWEMLEMSEQVYTRERYAACPVLRYCPRDERYYMIYLAALPCHRWEPYIVRTYDFSTFELGLQNPIMFANDEDKIVQHPEKYTAEQLEYIRGAVNCNNSDVDLCEFQGKTVILYSWGNQLGKEFLAEAQYDGPMEEFLHSFFAD